MRLLLDENISPALVRLWADIDVYSQSVPHVGLAGRPDHVVWQYALDHDFAVVTINARDFITASRLAACQFPNAVCFARVPGALLHFCFRPPRKQDLEESSTDLAVQLQTPLTAPELRIAR